MEENIDVCIRVRPLNEREIKSKDVNVLRCLPSMNAISITDRNGTPMTGPTSVFQYDHIFPDSVPTRTIYDEVAKRIVLSTLKGINGTIFAYGQTSSGKTHTMQGSPQNELGILPLAVQHIFRYIEQETDRDFLIRVSYVEIYNEVIHDLLCDDKEKTQNLKIREDPKKGIYLESQEVIITDYDSILRLVEQGEQRRAVGQTSMNERSSRSHSIFRIVIESKEKSASLRRSSEEDMNGAVLVGVLNLVDLAGSESVRHTSAEGMRQREAGNINRSLLTLSRVINSLAHGTESIQNAPFRDSKLTRLLQSSLAGSTRTLIICCVTPSDRHLEESKSTLQFAARAKNIQLSACVNEVLDDQAQLKRLKRELHELRKQVENDETLKALKAENMALIRAKTKQEAEILRLTGLIVTSSKAPNIKQKAKRTRETWGPGDVLNSFQGHSSDLEQVILGELQAMSQSQAKKRKERHSDGHSSEDQLSTHLKMQLESKEKLIRKLQTNDHACSTCNDVKLSAVEYENSLRQARSESTELQMKIDNLESRLVIGQPESSGPRNQVCTSCNDAQETAREFEALLQQVDSERTELQVKVDRLEAELQAVGSDRMSLTEELENASKSSATFTEIINELENSRDDAIEQMMQIESQQSELQVLLADQMKKTEAANEMVMILDEKCQRYERTIQAMEDSTDKHNQSSILGEYESRLQAVRDQHRQEINEWKLKQATWEEEMSKLKHEMQEEAVSLQMTNAALDEQVRLNNEATERIHSQLEDARGSSLNVEEKLAKKITALETSLKLLADDNKRELELLSRTKNIEIDSLRNIIQSSEVNAQASNSAEIQRLQETAKQLTDENNYLRQELGGMQVDKTSNECITQKMCRELDEQQHHSKELEGKLSKLEASLSTLTEEKANVEIIVHELTEASSKYKQQTCQTMDENAMNWRKREESLLSQVSSLTCEKNVFEQNTKDVIDGMENHIHQLQQDIGSRMQKDETLNAQIERLMMEKDEILQKMGASMQEIQDQNSSALKILAVELEQRDSDLTSIKLSMNHVKQNIHQERDLHKKEVNDLQDQIFNINVGKLQLQENLDSLLLEYNLLKDKCDETKFKGETFHASLSSLQNKVDKQYEEIVELGNRNKKYEKEISILNEAIQEWTSKYCDLECELKSRTSAHEVKESSFVEVLNGETEQKIILEESNQELRQKIQVITSKYDTTLLDVEKLAECIKEIEYLRKLLGESELQCNTLEDKSNKSQSVLKSQVELFEMQVEDLRNQLMTTLNEKRRVEEVLEVLRTEFEVIKEKFDVLLQEKQSLLIKTDDMAQTISLLKERGVDNSGHLKAELITLKNDLDAQLEEKEALYDKIDELEKKTILTQQSVEEQLHIQNRQWEMEKATLLDQMDGQRDRINKLELVKMTKHHLEVFQKMKLDNKKKSDEIASLQNKLQHSSVDSNDMHLMEERWKHEQKEKEIIQMKMAETKLQLKTVQNEYQIKSSEVISLQNTIAQFQELIESLQRQVKTQDVSFTEIHELKRQIDQMQKKIEIQGEQLVSQSQNIELQAHYMEEKKKEMEYLELELKEKDIQLKCSNEAATTKLQEWHACNEDLQDKYQSDLRYLEKENLELHLELKQAKRILAERGTSNTPAKRASLQEIQNQTPATKFLTESSPKRVPHAFPLSKSTDKENDPEMASQPNECNQQ
ncbi:Aste57867_581 [Aphanomyces stellatus]|uniref:Aste57867_581 protein n=1 Tax=Aphanomyces stellatus TaxID=120398 RepID=A0A485K361_9STRA|nr:hypothetical protein As57867_000580 [Aphanomyces stellatus]VFT77806.1 Aste57867_581 [Aphanomyces stellatus]